MFKDLRTSTKLAILCGMFLVAIGATTYSLFREQLIAIEFARKELAGTKYLAVVSRVFATVLANRPFDSSATPSNDALQDLLRDLATAEAEAAAKLQTAEPAEALTIALQSWSRNIESGAAAHVSALNVLEKAQHLITRISDDSNLTLDPDLDSYYLHTLVIGKIPEFIRQLAELQFLSQSTAAAPTDQQIVRSQFLAGLLRSTADKIAADVLSAYRGNHDGSLQQEIDGAFATLDSHTRAYLRGLNMSLAADGAAAIDIVTANGSYDRTVESAVSAWLTAQRELARLLQERIDGLLGRMRGSLALTGALAALSILVAAMTHWHVVRPLKRLENVTSSVRDSKDYSLRIDYSSKSEIGKLVSAFNKLLAELATALERERSERSEIARASRLTTGGAMTASIAHEINQPLAAIVANSNAAQRWLSNEPPDLHEVRTALKNIVTDGHRASRVIGSVRAIFKRESGEKGSLAVNDVIDDILAFVRAEIRKNNISLRKELHPDLPDVTADRTQLQQVIINIIMNAIEAMATVTDRERWLVVQSRPSDGANVEIIIRDTGVGIKAEDVENIFNAFYTTKSEGMGMGLFICRSIVETHGGRLWASPGIPHGSVFHVVLRSSQ